MQVKVVSLNIFQGAELDGICEFLEREKPDIVTLQEVFNSRDPGMEPCFRSLEELLKRLEFPFHHFEASYIDNRDEGKIPSGNATLSRFPITPKNAVFFNETFNDNYVDDFKDSSEQPHVMLHTTLQTPAGEVNVFNLHGTWDLDGDNFSEKRRQMSEAVITATKGKSNVILAGDTNAKPTNQAMRNIEEHLTSVFGTELTTTFNMKHKDNPGYATAAVDMIFVSPNIRIIAKDCPNVDVSDHLPLVVTLEIPEKNS